MNAEKHNLTLATTRECRHCRDFVTSNIELDDHAMADILKYLATEMEEQFVKDGFQHGKCRDCNIATARHDAEQHAADDRKDEMEVAK